MKRLLKRLALWLLRDEFTTLEARFVISNLEATTRAIPVNPGTIAGRLANRIGESLVDSGCFDLESRDDPEHRGRLYIGRVQLLKQ